MNRLTPALQEASAEKIQAAQYGLQVLEEKQQIEVKYADLDTQFETVRAELESAKTVSLQKTICSICYLFKTFSRFQTQHKVVTRSDVDHEDSILEESACREAE